MLVFKKEMMDMAVRVIRYGVQTGMNEWEGEIICPNCRERVRVKG